MKVLTEIQIQVAEKGNEEASELHLLCQSFNWHNCIHEAAHAVISICLGFRDFMWKQTMVRYVLSVISLKL